MNRRSGLITIYGSAGSGKSVLASQISTAALDDTLSFSFSTADYRRSSYRDLLLSFLLQILYRDATVFDSIYAQLVYSQSSWDSSVSSADLYRLFYAFLGALPNKQIVCVIDALDECDVESRIQLIGDFKRLALEGPVKCTVFLTCRPSDAMRTALGPFQENNSVNLDEHMKHVRSVILERELEGKKFRAIRNHLNEENATPLKASLIVALERMGGLLDIPDDYDSIYKRIMARIDAPSNWLETILHCIAFSRRPLTVDELAVAIGVDGFASKVGGTGLTLQKIRLAVPKQLQDDLEFAVSSLVYIQNNVVHLVHRTLRDFIRHGSGTIAQDRRPNHIRQANAGSLRALRRSLAILSVPGIRDIKDIATRRRPFDHLYSVPICRQAYNFARYAGFTLVHDLDIANHQDTLGELTKSATDAVSQFWDTIDIRSWWIQNFTALQEEADQMSRSSLETSLHLAVSLGIQPAVKKLLPEVGGSFNTLKSALRTAVGCGNVEMARLLLTPTLKLEEEIWYFTIHASCTYGRAEILTSVLLWRSESTGGELSRDELHSCLRQVAAHGYWHIIPALQTARRQLMDAIEREVIVSLIEVAANNGRDGVISQLLPIVSCVTDPNSLPTQSGKGVNQPETAAGAVNASHQGGDTARTEPESVIMDMIMEDAEDEAGPEKESEDDRAIDEDLGLGHAINQAILFGNMAAVHLLASTSRALLEYRTDDNQMTPLHHAALSGNANALAGLLDLGADINAVDGQDATALLLACSQRNSTATRHINTVKILLERGANPNRPPTGGAECRALHIAARTGQAALVRVLLEARASTNVRLGRPDRHTPLHLAVFHLVPIAEKQYVEVVQELLEAGADVNAPTGDGSTALHLAINANPLSRNMIKILVEFRADIDKLDGKGRSSLYYAVSYRKNEVAEMLWNPKGLPQGPVLFRAAAEGNVSRVRQLLDAGCDKMQRDKWGRTARDVGKNPEVRSLLAYPPMTSGTECDDDAEAAAAETMEGNERYPTTSKGIIAHRVWLCSVCCRIMRDEIFYHCSVCIADRKTLEKRDICSECLETSDCKSKGHRMSTRFTAEGLSSYEEFSPSIASFGHKVGDSTEEIEMAETP
ncbi:hypothetical protein F4859DRAFT_499429 [Xylaria cf. heliscus]|nr:hypothetical protein F4859DRAFT_499429 [Xylaria cf. heliscus]